MRRIKDILKTYLEVLNDENKLGYSEQKIKTLLDNEIETEVLKEQLEKELYSTEVYKGQMISSVRAFYLWCHVVHHKDLKTGDLIWNKFVKKQFIIVEQNKQVCYMAARGHGKSFFLALYVTFKMWLIDYFDIGYCANIPRQKRRFLKGVRSLIDKNAWLLLKKDTQGVARREVPWGADELEYNNGVLEGTTIGTTPRGGHYNLAIADDFLREDKKYPYERIIDYLQGALKQTILRKKGRYILVGTPFDPEDPFHTLMNSKLDKRNRPLGKVVTGKMSAAGYYSEVFPAILNHRTKEVLVPEIWNYEELMKEKNAIGEIRFNRELLCNCTSFKNSLIGSILFRRLCDEEYSILQKGENGKHYILVIDSATSDSPTADYCAMTLFEDDRINNKLILRHLVHKKGFPVTDPEGGTDDQIHKVMEINSLFQPLRIIVERNNAGVALIQGLRAKGLEVEEHFTHQQSQNREGKNQDVISYIEDAVKPCNVVIPANPECNITIDVLEQVKSEHLNFGVKQGRNGEIYEALAGHDDIFDTFWIGWKFKDNQNEPCAYAATVRG